MRRPFALAAAIGLCALLHAVPASAKRSVYSIAIGNNQAPSGEDGVADLRYADDDAVRYFELFGRAGKHAALLTVLDSASQRRHAALGATALPPTLAELRRTLDGFLPEMERDRQQGDQPVLFLTYSGHGAQDAHGEYFLSFLDGGLTQPLLYDEVLAKLQNIEVHLIVDACNAEGVVGTRGPLDRESEAEVVALSDEQREAVVHVRSLRRFPLVGALVATSRGQATHEWSRIEAGVFTHEVISALLGAADVNGDLRIEYSEVQAFVMAANQTVSDPRAVPQLMAEAPSARPHAVLMDLQDLEGAVFLTGSADQVGRLSLITPDGRRLLDIHVQGAMPVTLALPRQPGMYVQRGNDEAEIPIDSRVVAISDLTLKPSTSLARGSLDHELRDRLFSAPFSVDYYRGIVDGQDLAVVDFSSQSTRPLPAETHAQSTAALDTANTARATPRWVSTALLVTSGVSLVVAATTLVLALNTKADFEDTDRMREAYDLQDRYRTETAIAVVAAAIGVGSGVSAWLLWPRSESGAAQLGAGVRGRF